MNATKSALRIVAWAAHAVAALALLLACFQAPAMTLFSVVSGALAGCASVAAVPKRSPTLYILFGVLMGYGFWMGVSSINQRDFLGLIPVLLLEVGVAWLLKQPSWPAALFTAILTLALIVLTFVVFKQRHLLIGIDSDHIRRSAVTSFVVLGVGLLYLGVATAEILLLNPAGEKRKRRRVVRSRVEAADERSPDDSDY